MGREMLVVETIARIRREFFVKGKSIKEIARAGVSLALQLRKAAQQTGQIAASHLMARHLLACPWRQGRHEPDGATETVCSRGEGGSPSP